MGMGEPYYFTFCASILVKTGLYIYFLKGLGESVGDFRI